MAGWKQKTALAAVLLALFAWPAHAQTSGENTKVQNVTGIRIGGITAGDTTFHVVRVDGNGYLRAIDPDRDRDYSNITPGGFVNDTLGVLGFKFVAFPTPVSPYEQTNVLFSYNPAVAADSDSVNVIIYPVGKVSTATGDGQNMVIDVDRSTPGLQGFYLTRNNDAYTASVTGTQPIWLKAMTNSGASATIPPLAAIGSLYSNGAVIPQVDNLGVRFQVPIIGYLICNLRPTQLPTRASGGYALNNINLEVWGKVN